MLKIELPYDPAIALQGIYPRDTGMLSKGHMHPNVYGNIINNSRSMERAQMSINCSIDKEEWHIYTMEYYSGIKKKEILPFTMTWIELECFMLSEISQRKVKYMISLIREI